MADAAKPAKRRKVTHKNANPLFEEWLKEWRDEAKERGSQIHFTYHNVSLFYQKIIKTCSTKIALTGHESTAEIPSAHEDRPGVLNFEEFWNQTLFYA
jgi:hypothetical protein